eukprot:2741799-Amphidinium_carterae.1
MDVRKTALLRGSETKRRRSKGGKMIGFDSSFDHSSSYPQQHHHDEIAYGESAKDIKREKETVGT